MARSNSYGFSVIELVISITLIAIVSVTVGSRWFSADSFSANTLRASLMSEARLAQRTSLSNSETIVHLLVSQTGNQWRYQIVLEQGGVNTVMREVNADIDGIGIDVTAGGTTALSTSVDLDLQYDGLGNLRSIDIGGSAGVVSNGVLVSFNSSQQFCISPLGFAHSGACV